MITKKLFDKFEGRDIIAYTMTNATKSSVTILNYGGIINSLVVPDREGNFKDIVAGFSSIEDYRNGDGYHGALVGRFANRITGAKFTFHGKEYLMAQNDGENHLHGGNIGFNQKIWTVQEIEGNTEDRLILEYTSVDGEENYPGNLKVTVTYTFSDANILSIHYQAISDKDTIFSPTNHSYFNLLGYASCDINGHRCYIDADNYTEVDDSLAPTGNILPVDGTKFDFRHFKFMTDEIDHNFCLNKYPEFALACEVREGKEGRAMEVWTDRPGVQLYTANMMTAPVNFKGNVPQKKHTCFCLETQCYPDSVNHENFPSCELKAGEKFDSTTEFRFRTV